jgi:hypothetical protein
MESQKVAKSTYIVNDVASVCKVNRIDDFVVTVSLVTVQIFRLPTMSRIWLAISPQLGVNPRIKTHNEKRENRSAVHLARAIASP